MLRKVSDARVPGRKANGARVTFSFEYDQAQHPKYLHSSAARTVGCGAGCLQYPPGPKACSRGILGTTRAEKPRPLLTASSLVRYRRAGLNCDLREAQRTMPISFYCFVDMAELDIWAWSINAYWFLLGQTYTHVMHE